MTKDQLAKWANQAGAFLELSTTPEKDMAFLQRFAALVAAQAAAEEREACAKAVEQAGPKEGPLKLVTEGFAKAIRERK